MDISLWWHYSHCVIPVMESFLRYGGICCEFLNIAHGLVTAEGALIAPDAFTLWMLEEKDCELWTVKKINIIKIVQGGGGDVNGTSKGCFDPGYIHFERDYLPRGRMLKERKVRSRWVYGEIKFEKKRRRKGKKWCKNWPQLLNEDSIFMDQNLAWNRGIKMNRITDAAAKC